MFWSLGSNFILLGVHHLIRNQLFFVQVSQSTIVWCPGAPVSLCTGVLEQLLQQSLREQLLQQWLWELTFFGDCSTNFCWNSRSNNHCGKYCSNNDCGIKKIFDCCSNNFFFEIVVSTNVVRTTVHINS